MQKKKLIILILGLACIVSLTFLYIRFLVQGKQLPFFGTGKKEKPTDFVGQPQGSSIDEYRALSEKLMGLPPIAEYVVLPDSVLYAGTLIADADVATFQDLGASYAKDSKHIYFKGRVVPRADHDSFQVAVKNSDNEPPLTFVAEDKNTVFVDDKALDITKEALLFEFYSFPSLRFLGGGSGYDSSWAVLDDKLYYYFLDTYGAAHDAISLLEGVRPEKVRLLQDVQSQATRYITDGNDIYYADKKVDGADLDTFSIREGYARDRRSVYISGVKLKDADPKTFVLDESYIYSHDAKHVYYDTELIDGADTDTFRLVGNSYQYARDKDHVYYRGLKIPAADPSTFVEVGSVCNYGSYVIFSKDKNTIFRNGDRMKDLDPKTFEIIDEWYVRDADTILRCGTEKVFSIKPQEVSSDPVDEPKSSHKELGNNYEMDEQGNYYYRGYEKDSTGKYVDTERKVMGVDPETFAPFGSLYGWATDKDSVYWKGKVVGSNSL